MRSRGRYIIGKVSRLALDVLQQIHEVTVFVAGLDLILGIFKLGRANKRVAGKTVRAGYSMYQSRIEANWQKS